MKLSYVYLPVSDLEREVDLYRELGGKVVWQGPKTTILEWPSVNVQVMLSIESPDGTPAGLMFEVESVETLTLPSSVKEVKEPFVIPGGSCIEARDPSGNSLHFMDNSDE